MHKLYENKFRLPHPIIERNEDNLRGRAASTPGQQKICFSTTKQQDVSSYALLRTFFNL